MRVTPAITEVDFDDKGGSTSTHILSNETSA